MPDPHKPKKSDDELLAEAISIEDLEEIDDADDHGDKDLTPIEIDLAADDSHDTKHGADGTSGGTLGGSMIQMFGGTRVPHEDNWSRKTNVTGKGATHVKTFFCKLRPDAIQNIDEQVNDWLDKHPEYEVKFVTTTIGKLVGKNIEDALFMNVWV
ncbi:MAG: hypothetical protein AAF328_07895 [Planctomycetota bacterium]